MLSLNEVADKINSIQTQRSMGSKSVTFEQNRIIYGFTVDNKESDPVKRVVYTDDAVGLTPAQMSSSFNWGGWKNAWFNTGNHVYRMEKDGTIVGQCQDNNYAYFTDGKASGVSDSSHTDNFMASIPLCWVYRGMSGDKRVIKISNQQVDSKYKAYAHTDENGKVKDMIYWGVFRISQSKSILRSISGATQNIGGSYNDVIERLTYNGKGWNIMSWSDLQLRNDLFTLMFKSTDSQTALGMGYTASSTSDGIQKTGTLNTRGAFYGEKSGKERCKAFHCEDPWGNTSLLLNGAVNAYDSSGCNLKVKMTPPYNSDGSGYYTLLNFMTINNCWGSNTETSEYGTFWKPGSVGTTSTYECDEILMEYGGNYYSGVKYVLSGGHYTSSLRAGAWQLWSPFEARESFDVRVGATLTYK